MNYKFKKLLIELGAISLSVLSGCSTVPYNEKMYSMSNDWVSASFLNENKVKGAYYLNPDYDEAKDDPSNKYYYDETSPQSRVFTINDKEMYDTIFESSELQVDFDNDMVCLYIFADTYPHTECYIVNMNVDENNLDIIFDYNFSDVKDATSPYQRCLIVTMEKINVSNINFIKK